MKEKPNFAFGSKVWPGIAKVIEENSELNVELGMLVMTGGSEDHWKGNLRPRIVNELADSMAAQAFVADYCLTKEERELLAKRILLKFSTYVKWHEEGDPLP